VVSSAWPCLGLKGGLAVLGLADRRAGLTQPIKINELRPLCPLWNVVPVERETHQQHFNQFWREFEEL
jgi:hypothetical protein